MTPRLTLLLLALFLAAACDGGDGSDADAGDGSADGDADSDADAEPTWCDDTSGLCWLGAVVRNTANRELAAEYNGALVARLEGAESDDGFRALLEAISKSANTPDSQRARVVKMLEKI